MSLDSRMIVGGFEKVELSDYATDVVAKIDTGAFSGALHCTNISEQDGVLSFCLLGDSSKVIRTKAFKFRHVKSSHGHRQNRYIIPIKLKIQGREFRINIGLSDRTNMSRDMIIGRAFLRENNILVDVNRNVEYDNEWQSLNGKTA